MRPPHRRRHTALAALIVMALLLAACGSSEEESAPQERFTVGLVIPHPIVLNIYNQYRVEMAALGYVEGQNITYVEKGPPETVVDFLQYPSQLVDEDVDLMVVMATEGALIAQGATDDIPIVFIAGDAPVEAGLAQSLDKPGGNITGVIASGPEARRMELFLEMVPDIHTLYVPHTPGDLMADRSFREIVDAAETFDLELIPQPVMNEDDLQEAIHNIPEEADGIFIPQDMLVAIEAATWADEAIARKLPLSVPGVGDSAASPFPINPLMGYGLSVTDLAARAARLSDQILQGANPGDLPIEIGELYLMVNIDTAEAIGVEIPDYILEQAHFINHINSDEDDETEQS